LCGRTIRLPLRVAIGIEPDGLGGIRLKTLLSRILSFSSAENKRIILASEGLAALSEEGVCVAGVSFHLDTFVNILDYESMGEAIAALKRRKAELIKLVSGWGEAQCGECPGDPLLGVLSSIPGMRGAGGLGPKAACALQAAFSFIPIRPASPWREGALMLRTPDGKVSPFEPGSSKQASWIDLGLSPMGAGKSVLLNAINLAFILKHGAKSLGLISIIDVGMSSKGLIDLLRNALPKEMRPLAVFRRLRLTPEHSVNPMDTPLGLRKPFPSHMNFLVNFLSLLCAPAGGNPPAGAGGLLRLAIEGAYLSLQRRPRIFERDMSPELWERAKKAGFIGNKPRRSVWETVDYFFREGLIHEAVLLQRHAVPTLTDAASEIRSSPGIRAAYDFKLGETGENIRDYCWRSLTEAIRDYPILGKETSFSLGDARVMALDLDEVAPRGGGKAADKQTAVMYMLARFLTGSRFFLMPEDAKLAPPQYYAYHKERIREIRLVPKRLCYDELHRVTGEPAVRAQLAGDLETTVRESRKWNLSLGLYSQNVDDVPSPILELATSVFLLGSGTGKGSKRLSEIFGLSEELSKSLETLSKPGPSGADFISVLKSSEGMVKERMTLTLPPSLLWAFGTTTEDAALRSLLYERYGAERALRALSARYPYGVKAELERRKAPKRGGGDSLGASGGRETRVDPIEELAGELGEYIERMGW
jgi:intracellular multiplication protein IcmB